jgi:large subunit ribosomal protein L22
MKAILSNYTQSPRKVRLVSDLVKGKSVDEALTLLQFEIRRPADPLIKLIKSAVANAENKGERASDLIIKNITVDKGLVVRRFMPRAFGRATPIRRRRAHVSVTLERKGVVNTK